MKFNVFDKVEVISTGQIGKIIMLIGGTAREAWVDMHPGAASGYEYIRMWDEDEERVELRALNKYPIKDIRLLTEEEFEKFVEEWDKNMNEFSNG
jgi:hypothetical protein